MRASEFRLACAEEFGEAYAQVVLKDHWLVGLGATANDALADGVPPRRVWDELCQEFQVPDARRHGRGLRNPDRE